MKNNFYLDCLEKTSNATANIDIAYSENNEHFVRYILSSIPMVITDIETFFSCKIHPRISIFIYPDISSMSKAFGRELKSDQWCFVPIIGEESLITFTANINKETIPHVLIHELSHVYFSRITGNVDVGNYRQSVPLWLDEGVALYLDSKYRHDFDQTLRKRLSTLKSKENKYFPKLMDLYTYFNRLDEDEFGAKSLMAYAYSYFSVKDLIEQFGRGHMIDFIKQPDLANNFDFLFEAHFKFSLSTYNAKMTEKYSR